MVKELEFPVVKDSCQWKIWYCFLLTTKISLKHCVYVLRTSRPTHLEVSALWLQPVIDEALRISGKAEHELSLGFQLVNGLNGLMDLGRIREMIEKC